MDITLGYSGGGSRDSSVGILRFDEGYFARIWGGNRLRTLFAKDVPADTIGEAWLVSDHDVFESRVKDGPLKGRTLHDLVVENPRAILGERPRLTPSGRFPLLLKILDARDVLSVQVHPDDACALRLGEPDVGKTEMWHVLQADQGAEIICGLEPEMDAESFAKAVGEESVERHIMRYPARAGTSLFVASGTVHAIGAGIVLAEIQQNSDLTYRVYDWRRVDSEGRPRELHLDKALQAIHFGEHCPGPAPPLEYWNTGVHCSVLAACEHFAAELIDVKGLCQCDNDGQTFHIILATKGRLFFGDGAAAPVSILPGEALLIPGSLPWFRVEGEGAFLNYYVPDLEEDIIDPLFRINYSMPDILSLVHRG